ETCRVPEFAESAGGAARTSGFAGRCPGTIAGGLPRSHRPAASGRTIVSRSRPTHGTKRGQRAKTVAAGLGPFAPLLRRIRMRPKGQHRLGDSSRPFTSEADELPDDPRLLQAVQEYLDQLEKGRHPSRADFLHRYSVIAEPLARCLDGLELVHKAASKEKSLSSHAGRFAPAAEILTANPLGDFQIMHEIGRGGMGIVYEAVQLSLGRRVALKVLPFAATFDAKHLQRFHNEAQAAAHLHHSNIVPVYAVGAERGVHFYAMQLIEGQSLAVVIRHMRQQAGHSTTGDEEGGRGLPPRENILDLATVSYPSSVPPVEESVS